MLSRRLARQFLGALSATALAAAAQARQSCEVFSSGALAAVAPDAALKLLQQVHADYASAGEQCINTRMGA